MLFLKIQQFANMTTSVIEAMVSIQRLSAFLRAGELQTDARTVFDKEIQEGDEVMFSLMLSSYRSEFINSSNRFLKLKMASFTGIGPK